MRFLPSGKLLRQYKVLKVLGAGGFGITYLVKDETLDRHFAVKEYFPEEFALRNGVTVKVKSGRVDDYAWAKNRFIEEARVLARFDHRNIVKIIQIFEANNTAYMVQEYESGRNFKEWLDEIQGDPTQLELDCVVELLLIALELIHGNELLHRDIAPDNIYIRDDGSPVLLDFGSAKDAVAQRTKNVSAVVKSGYSPPELYSSRGRSQGPWSDIYALAATLYYAVTGAPPEEATERLLADNLAPAKQGARGDYRPAFLDAIDWGLKVAPKDRPQSVVEWRKAIFARGTSAEVALSEDPALAVARETKRVADKQEAIQMPITPPSNENVTPNVSPRKNQRFSTRPGFYVTAAAVIIVVGGIWVNWQGKLKSLISALSDHREIVSIRQEPEQKTLGVQESSAYAAAKGNLPRLKLYLKNCKLCTFAYQARNEVAAIEEINRPPQAPFWEYNGSKISLDASGETSKRRFQYDIPSAMMQRQGVRSGMVLFDGMRDRNKYQGTAFEFHAGCNPAAYAVSGDVSANERSVTLRGRAPQLNDHCALIGYNENVLLFVFHDQEDNWGRN